MDHETREHGEHLIIAFSGDIDLQSSSQARTVLLDAVSRGQPLLVDLSGVEYIDSSGVASLVESFQKARKSGLDYVLVSVSDGARRVLELARLDKVFTIVSTIDEATAGGS
ncbi:MAG: STAS domain-containing protein [Rhodospirillales bacterium]